MSENRHANTLVDVCVAAADEIERLEKALDEARAAIDKLPKTEDGVPICLGQVIWYCPARFRHSGMVTRISATEIQVRVTSKQHRGELRNWQLAFGDIYSTREAVEAAKGREV